MLRSLNIVAYNIAGIKDKFNDHNFIKFIYRYDIFFLFETFLCDPMIFEKIKNVLSDYNVIWIPAVRRSNFGRASGGSLYGYKKGERYGGKLEFVKLSSYVLRFEQSSGPTYIIPVYLNCNDWDNDFMYLNRCVMECKSPNLLLIGDFNGRIGNEQVLTKNVFRGIECLKNEVRRSKDIEVNRNGRTLLSFFTDFGLVVLNGRITGDVEGELTFVGGAGDSVIDLGVASISLMDYIDHFEVNNEWFSDHFPISTRLNIERNCMMENLAPLLPKLKWIDRNKCAYQRKMTELVEIQRRDSGNICLHDLVGMIHSSGAAVSNKRNNTNSFRNQWFDSECLQERKTVFKLLNVLRRTNSSTVRDQYLNSKRKYKALCTKKKLAFWNNCVESVSKVKDGKSFWKSVRRFVGRQFIMGENITAERWFDHFRTLLGADTVHHLICYAEPYVNDELLDTPFTKVELDNLLCRVKDNKAPGEDGIPYEFYKNAPNIFLLELVNVFNRFYERGTVPPAFTKSVIFPIHKKGDVDCVSNYRGISFGNTAMKLFAGLLLGRLEKWTSIHEVLNEFQAGFRKSYSTVDNLFSLMSIIKLKLTIKRHKVFAFFVDLSAAFDRIDRHALFYKLSRIGVSTKMLTAIRAMYTNCTSYVWCKEGLSKGFKTQTGVKQGCVLSPILFALFINDIADNLEGGVNIGGTEIKLLAYADDIVLLATDKVALENMVKSFERYCDDWALQVNLEKSKIVVFRNGGKPGRHERWFFKGNEVEVVNSYKYLGVILTSKLSLDNHFKQKLWKSKAAFNVFNVIFSHARINFAAKHKLFEALCRSVMCYGAEVWGSKMFDGVEKLQTFFIKRVFNLPMNSADSSLYLETGLLPLFVHTLKLHLQYIRRCLALDEHRYPKILLEEVITKQVFVYKDWESLARDYGFPVSCFMDLSFNINTLLSNVANKLQETFRQRRLMSAGRTLFADLCLFNEYVNSNENFSLMSWMLKCRAELIYLNKYSHRIAIKWCSLCNMREDEDVAHFVARCPVLKEYRTRFFGKHELTRVELIDYLNGKNWVMLSLFCRNAWKYRYALIQEFNYSNA
jgi:hypothetical protein